MAIGHGYIGDFIKASNIGMDGTLTFCISDITPIKESLDSFHYPSHRFRDPEVVWISLRSLRRFDWPNEDRFLKVLETEINK